MTGSRKNHYRTITNTNRTRFKDTRDLLAWALHLSSYEVLRLNDLGRKKDRILYEYAKSIIETRLTPEDIYTIMEISGHSAGNSDKESASMSYKLLHNEFKGETFKFSAPGDSLEGIFLKRRTVTVKGNAAEVADFKGSAGPVSIFLSTALKSRLTPDLYGKRLLITYVGDKTGENGGRPWKDYTIEEWVPEGDETDDFGSDEIDDLELDNISDDNIPF